MKLAVQGITQQNMDEIPSPFHQGAGRINRNPIDLPPGGAHKWMHEQAEDQAYVTNLTKENTSLKEQVTIYTNLLSTKESHNKALQTEVRNLQGEV